MKKLLILCLIPLSLWAKDPVFNGKNLDGWYAYTRTTGKVDDAGKIFQVKKGMIRLFGNKPGYIATDKSYKNFKLTLEFRWNEDKGVIGASKSRNSGVMFHVPKTTPDTLWPQGIQFQVKEGATGDFILLKNVTLQHNKKSIEPGASVVVSGRKGFEKPAGQWNQLVIKVKNDTVTQVLNGHVVNVGVHPSVDKGRILFQYEGYPIDFRNIKLKSYKKKD